MNIIETFEINMHWNSFMDLMNSMNFKSVAGSTYKDEPFEWFNSSKYCGIIKVITSINDDSIEYKQFILLYEYNSDLIKYLRSLSKLQTFI